LKCLDAFADYRAFTSSFPWILQSLIALKTNSNTFSELSQLVLANAFGGLIDWERAEQRWVKSGLTKSDLVAANRRVSIGGGIGKLGCPPLLRLELTHEPLDLPRAVDLLAAACEVRDDEAIYRLSHVALFIMHNPDIERRIDASSFVTTIADRVANMSSPYRGMLLKELLESILAPFNDSTFLMFLHELARDNPFYFISMRHSFGRLKANDLVKIFIDRNELRGLLVIVAKYVLVAKVQVDTLSATDLTWRSDDSESIVLAVAILKLATGHWDFSEVEILAEHLVAAAKFDAGVIKLLSRAEGSTHGLELLLSIGKRTDELPVRLYSEYADVLKRLSNIRPSSMRDVTVRSRLLLPCHTSEEN
jgi:hypothetical protein